MEIVDKDGKEIRGKDFIGCNIIVSAERLVLVKQLFYEIIRASQITQSEAAIALAELNFSNGVSAGVRLEKAQKNQPKNNT